MTYIIIPGLERNRAWVELAFGLNRKDISDFITNNDQETDT